MSPPSDRGPRARERTSDEAELPARHQTGNAVHGTVRTALPNSMYAVELEDGRKVLSHVATSLQTRTVRILPGDQVTVEVSPYDPLRGRITQRHR